METKFIKYKPEQVNLAQLYRFSSGSDLGNTDVHDGTLIVGYSDNGMYPTMGYLRGITQSEKTGKILYEIVNAVEGQEYLTLIENPYKVDSDRLPYFAAVTGSSKEPLIGKIVKCNGEVAVIYDGSTTIAVNVNKIYKFAPVFKETK